MQLSTAIGFLLGAFGIAFYVWYAFELSRLFPIFGVESWKGFIPLYNTALLFRLAAFNPLYVLTAFVPLLGAIAVWVIQVLAMRKLASHYWRDDSETLLLASFLPPFWLRCFTAVLSGATANDSSHSANNPAAAGGGGIAGAASAPVAGTAGAPAAAQQSAEQQLQKSRSDVVGATVVSSGGSQITPQINTAGQVTEPYRAKRAQQDPQTELISQSQPPQAAVPPAAVGIRKTGQMQNTSDSDSFADQSMTSSDSSLVMSVGTATVVEAQLAALDAAALAAETDPTGTCTSSQLIADAPADDSSGQARCEDDAEQSHVGDSATSHIASAAPAHAAMDSAVNAAPVHAAQGLREPKTVSGGSVAPAHAAKDQEAAADALARAVAVDQDTDDSAVAGEVPITAATAVATEPIASEQHAAVQQDEAAQDGEGLFHDLDNTDDSTVVVPREEERPEWELVLADGTAFTLHGDDIVVGRDPKTAGAKLKLPDVTKTLSRSHARFTYVESEDSWQIEDLGSQNGTVIYPPGVVEHELTAGVKETATSQMLLGTLPVTLRHKD